MHDTANLLFCHPQELAAAREELASLRLSAAQAADGSQEAEERLVMLRHEVCAAPAPAFCSMEMWSLLCALLRWACCGLSGFTWEASGPCLLDMLVCSGSRDAACPGRAGPGEGSRTCRGRGGAGCSTGGPEFHAGALRQRPGSQE